MNYFLYNIEGNSSQVHDPSIEYILGHLGQEYSVWFITNLVVVKYSLPTNRNCLKRTFSLQSNAQYTTTNIENSFNIPFMLQIYKSTKIAILNMTSKRVKLTSLTTEKNAKFSYTEFN